MKKSFRTKNFSLFPGQIEITPSDVEPFLRVANDLKIWWVFFFPLFYVSCFFLSYHKINGSSVQCCGALRNLGAGAVWDRLRLYSPGFLFDSMTFQFYPLSFLSFFYSIVLNSLKIYYFPSFFLLLCSLHFLMTLSNISVGYTKTTATSCPRPPSSPGWTDPLNPTPV